MAGLKLPNTGIDTVEQANPAESPGCGQPIQPGGMNDPHRRSTATLNPVRHGAVGLIGDQKATENYYGLIQRNRFRI